MIGTVQMICGMGAIIGALGLIFGPDRVKWFWTMICCSAVWWLLACAFEFATPE